MPRVFCPECLRGNNFKATNKFARCQGCRTNLYEHFILNKDESEIDNLILESDKRRKDRDEAERLKKIEEEEARQRKWEEIEREESQIKTIKIITSAVILLISTWFIWGWVGDFFSEDAVAERERLYEERRIIREQQEAQQIEENIREFESKLARNYAEVEYLDLEEFAKIHVGETEIQNNETEERMLNNYYRMTGYVTDVDNSRGEKYGYKSYMIQIFEPTIYVTARCWAKSEADLKKINSVRKGEIFSISGKVSRYGDQLGIMLENCSVL